MNIFLYSLQEADLGFHLIVDRRTDKWNSVKTVLIKISVSMKRLKYLKRVQSYLCKILKLILITMTYICIFIDGKNLMIN